MSNTPTYPQSSKLPYRYPGVQPFTTAQSEVFFGRDQDISELYRLIRREALVVLYGKSGLGKSSLLNAGIVPHCQETAEYDPITIKFGAWTEDTTDSPLDRTKNFLKSGQTPSPVLQQLLPKEDSLWRSAKNRQLNGAGRPLLVFDQFEELFTYPEADIQAFRQELVELLHTELPLRYRRLLNATKAPQLSEEEEDGLEKPLDARIVFSIRSDRMHLLHQLADTLPNILRNLYELRALRPEDARIAITAPAQKTGEFCTPAFTWSAPALDKLLQYLQDPDDENRVEAILLQLLCQYFEETLVEEKALSQIESSHLGQLEYIIENYYHDKLSALPDEGTRFAARKLIEEGLVLEGENIRLSLHEAQITRQYGVDQDLLERLVNSRLLRAEPFLRGGYTYELAHDRLVAPVLKAKQERLMREAQEAEEAARLETQQKLEAEQRKRRQANRIAIGGFALAVIALLSLLETLSTLNSLKKATANVVHSNLKEAEEFILELNYAAALQKMSAAAKLGAHKKEVANALLEIAFWYVETNKFQKAENIIQNALKLAPSPGAQNAIAALDGKAAPERRTLLRQSIQQFDAQLYQKCWQRYYPEMIKVEGGSFMMGCDKQIDALCEQDELLHPVRLNDYEIAATETTVWQWHLYCENNGLSIKEYLGPGWDKMGDNPVVNVSWGGALQYANWLSKRMNYQERYSYTKKKELTPFSADSIFVITAATQINGSNGYGLPSEAQWEYAAKGGKFQTPFIYSGHNEIDSIAWYTSNSGGRTRPCKDKKPNQLGIYGMSGNVWEWCWDWYGAYNLQQKSNPLGPDTGSLRVYRGGSWANVAINARVANRFNGFPHYRNDGIGLRLVRR